MVRKKSLSLVVSLALVTLVSTGCALPFGPKAEETEPVPVAVELDSVVALGRIEPEGEVIRVSVPNAADSRVNEVRVAAGDRVEAGQVIAILQGAERRQAALQSALALVKQRQAKLSQSQTGSVKAGSVEAQQARIARPEAQLIAQFRQRQASMESAQASLQESQANYQRYQLGTVSFGEGETNPTQDVNARVVTVKIRLDEEASEAVATLTGMQVRVAIDIEEDVAGI
jgi:HlyD family secretion protein